MAIKHWKHATMQVINEMIVVNKNPKAMRCFDGLQIQMLMKKIKNNAKD